MENEIEMTDKRGVVLSPKNVNSLALELRFHHFSSPFLREESLPKGTEKPGPLTSFLTSRITVGYLSTTF